MPLRSTGKKLSMKSARKCLKGSIPYSPNPSAISLEGQRICQNTSRQCFTPIPEPQLRPARAQHPFIPVLHAYRLRLPGPKEVNYRVAASSLAADWLTAVAYGPQGKHIIRSLEVGASRSSVGFRGSGFAVRVIACLFIWQTTPKRERSGEFKGIESFSLRVQHRFPCPSDGVVP